MNDMSWTRHFLVTLSLGSLALLFTACGPTYPKCENDGHCEDKGEYCLNMKCEECRENTHCKGAGMQCAAGSCERIPGYCDDTIKCPGKQKCRDQRCGPECLDDKECSETDYCDSGSCTARPECGDNALNPTCPEGKECVSGGCQIKLISCNSEPVYFNYNSSTIKRNQRKTLESVAECLKGENVAVHTVEGHCDERGTEEYNMMLGERRADATRQYLERKGVPADRLNTRSYGKERPAVEGSNERAWKKNRRSEFISQ